MRQFASGARLWGLPTEARLVYSCFCALSLLALCSSVLLYGDIASVGGPQGQIERLKGYYGPAGVPLAEPGAPVGKRDAAAGPEIALPDEVAAAPLTVAIPYRKLLEVSHFHLFTMPVFLLIISHLFMLTGLGPWWKRWWIVLGWSGAALHIAAPWLVRYASARLTVLYPISGTGLLLGSCSMTVYPLWVMWAGKPSPRQAHEHGHGKHPPAHGPG